MRLIPEGSGAFHCLPVSPVCGFLIFKDMFLHSGFQYNLFYVPILCKMSQGMSTRLAAIVICIVLLGLPLCNLPL